MKKTCAYKDCQNPVPSIKNRQYCALHSKVKNKTGKIKCKHPGCKTTITLTSFRRYCDKHRQPEFVKLRGLWWRNKQRKTTKVKTSKCPFCEHLRGVKEHDGYCSAACKNAGLRFLTHKAKTPPTVYVAQSNYGIVHPWPTFRGI